MPPVKVRWLVLLILVGALAASAAVAAALGPDAGARPTLLLASEQPLVVLGRSFKAGELVTVSATTASGPARRSVAAGVKGKFSVRLGAIDATCGVLYVRAVGQKGSTAAFRRRGVPPPCGIDPAPGVELDR